VNNFEKNSLLLSYYKRVVSQLHPLPGEWFLIVTSTSLEKYNFHLLHPLPFLFNNFFFSFLKENCTIYCNQLK